MADEALKSAGYVTGHFGKWHIGSVQPNSPTNPGGAGFDEWLSGLNFFDNDLYLSRNGEYEQIKGAGTVISMDARIEFLQKHNNGDKPMFTVTWCPSPHDPQKEIPEGTADSAALYDDQKTPKPGYFREITLLDQQMGRLNQCLRDLEIEENTFFLYCSDNGGLVLESSGRRSKKGSTYEGGLRVSAVLRWPAKYESRQIDTPVFTADLYPTLLSIAGASVSQQPFLDGVDLNDIIQGMVRSRPPMGFRHGFQSGQSTWSDRIIKTLMEAKRNGKPNPFPERLLKNVNVFSAFDQHALNGHAAWNAWPWKLHRIEENGEVVLELYPFTDDPMETNDLSEQHADRVGEMRASLEAWQRSVILLGKRLDIS